MNPLLTLVIGLGLYTLSIMNCFSSGLPSTAIISPSNREMFCIPSLRDIDLVSWPD